MTNFAKIYFAINKFYWTNKALTYPNAILITRDQLYSYYPQLKDEEDVSIESLCGLRVVLTDYIESPRLLKL